MKYCVFEAIDILNSVTEQLNRSNDVGTEGFVRELNDIAGTSFDAEMYATMEDVMRDFVAEHIG